MSNGTTTWTNTYNADGLRTKRTNGSTTYSYVYTGSSLLSMSVGNDTLYFNYDAAGIPLTVTYNGTTYYYATNLQGDVVAILDSTGATVVSYTYDAWGNPISTTGTLATTLGQYNPLRYRGYVYDQETGLYYLQSRYYDPEVGRFVNADGYTSTGTGLLGRNMFSYCNNSPIVLVDGAGSRPVVGASLEHETADERKMSSQYMRDLSPIYAEEYAVLRGDTDTYKGVKVVRVGGDGTGSFSFGIIFLSINTEVNIEGVRLLRHEYGHTRQLEELGVIGYIACVVIPSVKGFRKQQQGTLEVDYYSQPWEFEADLYGDVPSRKSYDPRAWEWLVEYNYFRKRMPGR